MRFRLATLVCMTTVSALLVAWILPAYRQANLRSQLYRLNTITWTSRELSRYADDPYGFHDWCDGTPGTPIGHVTNNLLDSVVHRRSLSMFF